jgi:hypothetical protein
MYQLNCIGSSRALFLHMSLEGDNAAVKVCLYTVSGRPHPLGAGCLPWLAQTMCILHDCVLHTSGVGMGVTPAQRATETAARTDTEQDQNLLSVHSRWEVCGVLLACSIVVLAC